MNKQNLRSRILRLRKKNNDKNFELECNKFYHFLKKNSNDLKSIGGYYPSNFEINDLKILNFLEKKNYVISLPSIRKNNQMDFFRWSNNDPLKINNYGIPEPILLNKVYPDILLVPLVGFDNDLNRLGYGGGFYDRYIEKIEKVKKVLKIGLAFSFQKITSIPINQYDKRLDFIVTEKEILK